MITLPMRSQSKVLPKPDLVKQRLQEIVYEESRNRDMLSRYGKPLQTVRDKVQMHRHESELRPKSRQKIVLGPD